MFAETSVRCQAIVGEMFRQRSLELTALAVEMGGDRLHFVLDEGFSVDVMPDDSTAGEHWSRFAPQENDPHFIFAGKESRRSKEQTKITVVKSRGC